MDDQIFDSLARTVASTLPTRRSLLAGLGGAGLAALLTHLGWTDVEAKKKRKMKRKKCKRSQKRCGKRCIPKSRCCTNANCGTGGVCLRGACACLDGFKLCQGRCIPNTECCPSNCDDGNPCTTGACENGTCVQTLVADLTDCGGGRQCSGGVCATRPTCGAHGTSCNENSALCCSNFCPGFTCAFGVLGRPCHTTSDCNPGMETCVGFVCTT